VTQKTTVKTLYEHFADGLDRVCGKYDTMRIGAELKFPLVNNDGTAVSIEKVDALWKYLSTTGWTMEQDSSSGKVIGAKKPGECNDTVASCETGYCKPEFSLAHVANLHEMHKAIETLREELQPFADKEEVHFLGYGIQPVTPPGKHLLMKKTRTSVWDKVFGANRILSPEDGDDVCLFTVNAANHIHVGVDRDDMIKAVNVLNGFSGAQLALTADSSVWRGKKDPHFKCVSEKLWDWWMPEGARVGIPHHPFTDFRHYMETIYGFRPVYVKRAGEPLLLKNYTSFRDYYNSERAFGIDSQGNARAVVPHIDDIALHNSCYWYNTRISRYYTVENRTNDQQPPSELIAIAALTLGLMHALDESMEVIDAHPWDQLRMVRESACKSGLEPDNEASIQTADLAGSMVECAQRGLKRRGLGEEQFLAPFKMRLTTKRCPADDAIEIFENEGIEALVANRAF